MSEHVGKPIKDDRCACKHCLHVRMVKAGWTPGHGLTPTQFLQMVPMVEPIRDVVPAHVAQATARFDELIADAEQVVDAELDAFTTAETAYIEAIRAEQDADAQFFFTNADPASTLVMPNGVNRDDAKRVARRHLAETFAQREKRSADLRKAKIRYSQLVTQREQAARLARDRGPDGLAAIDAGAHVEP